jgi:uncharacterized protein (UPF0276 family)
MEPLTRADLMSLEEYASKRIAFREQVMQHKLERRVLIGDHATLHFEDRMIMQYQVQEMLRLERIFEAELIQEELDVYNALIPNGSNWKATFMIEFPDVDQRKVELARLIGIEEKTWMQVGDHDKVYPIANEDLERSTEDKTSSVHFMRWELTPDMVKDAKAGAAIKAGIDHPNYNVSVTLNEAQRASLASDLS